MKNINIRYLLCTLAYLSFIILIIVLADMGTAPWIFVFAKLLPLGDKICHLILIGLLSFFVNSTLYCKEIKIYQYKILTGSLIVMILVLMEELSQVFVTNRSADIFDALADIIGIWLFGMLARMNLKHKKINRAA